MVTHSADENLSTSQPAIKPDSTPRPTASVASYLRSALLGRSDPPLATSSKIDCSDGNQTAPSFANASETCSSSKSAEIPSPSFQSDDNDDEPSGAAAEPSETLVNALKREDPSPTTWTKRSYEVRSECVDPRDVDNNQLEEERDSVMYIDVLLTADSAGVGLNISAGTRSGKPVLVVKSFRRLHAEDVGPAEASGKIRVGDALHSVDGEQILSMVSLHATMAGVKTGTFVLLRFLRHPQLYEPDEASDTDISPEKCVESPEQMQPSCLLDVEHCVRDSPQVAALIRGLATSNQSLQAQLLASRLKQDELTIQLDQLYALYARTQLERQTPAFSFSKTIRPFVRRSPKSPRQAAAADDATSTSNNSRNGRSGNTYSSKVLLEIEDAVNTETSRLRRHFEFQYELDKQQLERHFATRTRVLEAAVARKVEMLEAGFEHARHEFGEQVRDEPSVDRCCCIDQQSQQVRAHTSSTDHAASQKLEMIRELLDAYQRTRQQLDRELSNELEDKAPTAFVDNDISRNQVLEIDPYHNAPTKLR